MKLPKYTPSQLKGISFIMMSLTIIHLITITGLTHWLKVNENEDLIVLLNSKNEAIEIHLPKQYQDSIPKANPFYPSRKDSTQSLNPELIEFNPNEAGKEIMMRFGITERVASNILKYRSAGGFFKECSDLRKIYGFKEEWLLAIENYCTCSSAIEKNEPTKMLIPRTININTAPSDSLQLLKGIGPVLSSRIVKYRKRLGGFHKIDQLKEVYGIEDSVFNSFKKQLTAEGDLMKIDLNNADFTELHSHFYIDYNTTKAILNYRKQHGPFSNVESIKNIILIKDSVYHLIQPYLTVEKIDTMK